MINHDLSRLFMTNHHPIGRGIPSCSVVKFVLDLVNRAVSNKSKG